MIRRKWNYPDSRLNSSLAEKQTPWLTGVKLLYFINPDNSS
jgi:hypothetical protein